jgi:ABC-type antimicrobial peptide transport system permease subunit
VGLQSLNDISADINKLPNSSGTAGGVIGALRPVEIVNFRSMGTTPAILAAGLSLGAIVALGLTLSASVRRRRRDLALLKTMGFSRRQLFASIAWQATAAAVVGIAIGIPIGVVIGRQLWLLFARSIAVVPDATAPITTLIAIAVGAIVFANLVAVFPGRTAASTSTAIVLRSE